MLPQLSKHTHEITFPLSKITTTFRPYTVGDEKLLLAASAAKDDDAKFYINNTLKVIRNCINDTDGILEKLVSAEVELLLLKIRAKSVGEKVTVKYKEPSADAKAKPIELEIDLDQFRIDVDPEHLYEIKLSEGIGMVMKDISFVDKINYSVKYKGNNKTDVIFQTIVDCVVSVYDAETVYTVGQNCTKAEVMQFIEHLSGVSDKLYKFISTMPQIAVDVIHPQTGETLTLKGSEIDFLALSPATSI
jgi:hypothetical protein